MNQAIGNIWDFHAQGMHIVIPTNCHGVMGAGLARQARERFPDLELAYKRACREEGYKPFIYLDNPRRILLLPTKHHWQEDASPALIYAMLLSLRQWAQKNPTVKIAVPALGAGLGRLPLHEVQRLMESILDSNQFTLVLLGEAVGAPENKERRW
jgi:O-acetyl-ADP-ribose deacetylase (regulator of RNase III)